MISAKCFSAGSGLAGKQRQPITQRKPRPITCRVEKIGGTKPTPYFGRRSFPPGFTFGAASSSYQVEGGVNEGGRGPSIWDTFTHDHPEKIVDGSNGDVAVDSYHRYKEDVKILKDIGLDAYRFSISWPRILPKGNLKGGISQEGIDYYNNLINELLANGIKPYVTLFHWDLPQALEDEYGGFLSRNIVNDFKDYCELCFKEFGDRVQHWITINEPSTFCTLGYGLGTHAPGRCSETMGCAAGDSLREPYIVAHNLILAHATAYRLYEEKFKATQKGDVGLSLVILWYLPHSDARADFAAAIRCIDCSFGWYMEPLAFGDYPFSIRAVARDRLPYFTKEEAEMVKDAYDFIGINYYSARYASYNRTLTENFLPNTFMEETYATVRDEKDGKPIGELHGDWIYVYPEGVKASLLEIKERYNNPTVYISENGTCEVDDSSDVLTPGEALNDEHRISYFSSHLASVQEAIRSGANVKGFFAWSLSDNFEWASGYTNRFGLVYIDYKNNLERHPKDSSKWFTRFLSS